MAKINMLQPIDHGQIRAENSQSREYPLKSPYQAFEIMRTYQLGRLKSIEYNPDPVQVSVSRQTETWIHRNGTSLQLDVGSKRDTLYINIIFALQELFRELPKHDEKRQAFEAYYIGVPDKESDTGDAVTYPMRQIAESLGRARRSVARWVDDLYREFTEILVKRQLLNPESLN